MPLSPPKAETVRHPQREAMRRELVRLRYKGSTIQSYIGWVADFAATMIYVHLARKPGETVKSPIDV